jgi:Otopetrin
MKMILNFDSVANSRIVYVSEQKNNTYQAKKRVPHFGSFYLRVGAIAFGIGTMVYSGLEIGQYFELNREWN